MDNEQWTINNGQLTMDNCKNAKFCVPTITIETRNIETIDKSFNQILCFCLPNKKVGKTAKTT